MIAARRLQTLAFQQKAAFSSSPAVTGLMDTVRQRDPDQHLFQQAVGEVLHSLEPVFEKYPSSVKTMERLLEPERVIQFRVPWVDANGVEQVNRGFRVQFNSALGPYKGGLRFHPSVDLSTIKFLGFEQIFKNSLTGLMLGGGKGGSDFDPKGKSDLEVMSFCQSFMTELSRHINADRDVPAGDIGVGGRELGAMFGQYKRLTGSFEGVLTGKDPKWGGSLIRPEATGYGVVYYAQEMVAYKGDTLAGKKCLVSGSGNVSQFTVEKLLDLGAVPITVSDSGGYIHEPNGITREGLAEIMRIKNVARGRISEYANWSSTATYHEGERPWGLQAEVAFPCATQNEIEDADSQVLIDNGVSIVCEGANMPSSLEAISNFQKAGVMYGPSKAANAGGVAVSGLEMAQDSQRLMWTREEVDARLNNIMKNVFSSCVSAADEFGAPGNLQLGANVAGYLKVAGAMEEQGWC